MNEHSDDATILALTGKLRDVASYTTSTSMAWGILHAIRANKIPNIYHVDAIPDYTQDAMRKIDTLEIQRKDNYSAAMTALAELDKAKAEILKLQLAAADDEDRVKSADSENKELRRKFDALKNEVHCAWVPLSCAQDKRSLSHACADICVQAKDSLKQRDKIAEQLLSVKDNLRDLFVRIDVALAAVKKSS